MFFGFGGVLKMKFIIDRISKNSGRLGHLVQAHTKKEYHTPLLIQSTKSGSIPYLSREVFDYVSEELPILQLSLFTMNHMTESLKLFTGGGISAYVGFSQSPTVLMVRDTCETMPSGFNDKNVVPLFTRRGKETLSPRSYMDAVEVFKPDIYQGLCDADTCESSAKKRIQKSLDRTTEFMDYCFERHKSSQVLSNSTLFAPIVGGYSTYARSESIKHTRSKGEDINGGYIFEGFHNYGLSATEVNVEKLITIVTHCVNELESEKPKLIPGAYTPVVLLELICLGVDIFDTSYAYLSAANYQALTFNFDVNKKEEQENTTEEGPLLDLTDESLKEDFTPVRLNCQCLTCKQHTRAYIYHLYNTKELLGPILLMIHNLHHFMTFFETIRSCIAEDNLPALIKLIKFQNKEGEEADYSIKENTKVIRPTSLGKGFVTAKQKNL